MEHQLKVPISPGELLDKITILEITAERIEDAEKQKNVEHELSLLSTLWRQTIRKSDDIANLRNQLKKINLQLWEVEDDIRDCERQTDFGERFVELARAVYKTNDQRAAVKRQINVALGSNLVEEKSYQEY